MALLRSMPMVAARWSGRPLTYLLQGPVHREFARECGKDLRDVLRGRRGEQSCSHVCGTGETVAIPTQVFAHGLKLYAIGKTLEVAGMLQGHLAALA